MFKAINILGEGAFFLGAGGFMRAALSLAAFRSLTIIEGETPCLFLCPLELRLCRGERDLDL